MSELRVSPSTDNTRTRRMRWFHLLWLLLPAALVVWWVFIRPADYRQTASYTADGTLLIPAQTGFLYREGPYTFVFRGWQGGERWRVTTPTPANKSLRSFANLTRQGAAYALSPDGHVFAAATETTTGVQVQTWRDGAAAGEARLPLPKPAEAPERYARALNSGRVYFWFTRVVSGSKTELWAVDGGAVTAHGAYAPNALLSLDGDRIVAVRVGDFTCADVGIAGGAFTFAHEKTYKESLASATIYQGFVIENTWFSDGAILAPSGAVFRRDGRNDPTGDWKHDTQAPGGEYTLEKMPGFSRVFVPATGKCWQFPVKGENLGGDATADGRHALAYLSSSTTEEFEGMQKRYPALRALGLNSTQFLVLFEQPGRRKAVLRMRPERWWPDVTLDNDHWWYPSPDGRTIAMTLKSGTSARCLLFRY